LKNILLLCPADCDKALTIVCSYTVCCTQYDWLPVTATTELFVTVGLKWFAVAFLFIFIATIKKLQLFKNSLLFIGILNVKLLTLKYYDSYIDTTSAG